jgi:hypothetical protein
MSTTRFPNGVTNVAPGTVLGAMGQLDPTKYITAYSDFVESETGFGAVIDVVPIDGIGGQATIATTKAAVTPKKAFILDPTKEFYITAQVSLSALTASSYVAVGIADSLSTQTKGALLTLTTGTSLVLTVKGASTSTVTIPVSVAATTMTELGLSYIPGKGFKIFLNGTVVGSLTDASNLDATTLCVGGVYSSLITTTIDYIFLAVER